MLEQTRKRWTPLALLQRGLPVLAGNTVIALGLTAVGDGDFGGNLVYSHCIGICIWLLIEVSRFGLMRDAKQQWRRLYLIVPLCVTLGYVAGIYLAARLLSDQGIGIWSEHPRLMLGYLLLSLLAGGALTYYFMSREQLASAGEATALASAQAEAAQRHAAESKLVLLQSQLEPHMLFNTLANLRALISTDPAAATAMLDRLNGYLRATLNASRATAHPLQMEFDRLRDYLELIKVRMGPRLRYTLELPAELTQVLMPPLLLQPLVENAIKHGLEPTVDGGSIAVRAMRAEEQLVLEVSDTGAGFDATRAALESADGGFGLSQVRERIAAAYGERGRLESASTCGAGSTIRIHLPFSIGNR